MRRCGGCNVVVLLPLLLLLRWHQFRVLVSCLPVCLLVFNVHQVSVMGWRWVTTRAQHSSHEVGGFAQRVYAVHMYTRAAQRTKQAALCAVLRSVVTRCAVLCAVLHIEDLTVQMLLVFVCAQAAVPFPALPYSAPYLVN